MINNKARQLFLEGFTALWNEYLDEGEYPKTEETLQSYEFWRGWKAKRTELGEFMEWLVKRYENEGKKALSEMQKIKKEKVVSRNNS